MVGFNGVLKSDFQSKFTLILAEERPALYTSDNLSTIVKNRGLDSETCMNVVSFVYKNLETLGNIQLHDYTKQPLADPETLFSNLTTGLRSDRRNILILDDLGLLSVNNDRCSQKLYNFFKQLSKLYYQIVVFCTVCTMSKQEVSLLCNLAEHVVVLKNPGDDNEQRFPCNILTLKPSGKTSLDQVHVEFQNGNIIETQMKVDDVAKASGPSDDVMRNLTTFKLTIEESEKESKNKLYLPYLDAQRVAVPDPLDEFYDDDDEEDEDD